MGFQEKVSSLPAPLTFAKLYRNKPQSLEQCSLDRRDQSRDVWPYEHKHLKANVKHGGGGQMIWACSAATGPEHLAVTVTELTVYQSILELNVRPSICQLKCCMKLSHTTGQRSEVNQQICNRMSEKEKILGNEMDPPKSRPQSKRNAVVGPKESCAEMNVCEPQ